MYILMGRSCYKQVVTEQERGAFAFMMKTFLMGKQELLVDCDEGCLRAMKQKDVLSKPPPLSYQPGSAVIPLVSWGVSSGFFPGCKPGSDSPPAWWCIGLGILEYTHVISNSVIKSHKYSPIGFPVAAGESSLEARGRCSWKYSLLCWFSRLYMESVGRSLWG